MGEHFRAEANAESSVFVWKEVTKFPDGLEGTRNEKNKWCGVDDNWKNKTYKRQLFVALNMSLRLRNESAETARGAFAETVRNVSAKSAQSAWKVCAGVGGKVSARKVCGYSVRKKCAGEVGGKRVRKKCAEKVSAGNCLLKKCVESVRQIKWPMKRCVERGPPNQGRREGR